MIGGSSNSKHNKIVHIHHDVPGPERIVEKIVDRIVEVEKILEHFIPVEVIRYVEGPTSYIAESIERVREVEVLQVVNHERLVLPPAPQKFAELVRAIWSLVKSYYSR